MIIREEIPPALEGERLDRVVALITGWSRSAVLPLIADGHVLVNDAEPTERVTRLRVGDVVVVDLPDTADDERPMVSSSVEFSVVHEDAAVIVVDKPAGLVVHPGAGHADDTLVNGLLHRYPDIAEVGDPARPGIVHRLDKDTSGLLVVARTDDAHAALVAAHRRDRYGRPVPARPRPCRPWPGARSPNRHSRAHSTGTWKMASGCFR